MTVSLEMKHFDVFLRFVDDSIWICIHKIIEQLSKITTTTVVWWHGGVGKARFQQSATTHSGTGEKETLNINVVGNTTNKKTCQNNN